MKGISTMLLFTALVFGNITIPAQAGEVVDIHRYSQEGVGSVNSYIVETSGAVVLIDSQRVLSQGKIVAERIAAIGKPLQAVLLTHPHPDHFGGLAAILEAFPGVPVYASEATVEEMRTDGNGFMAATREVAADDAPTVFPLPDHTFIDGEKLTFDGVDFVVDEIGAGESETMSMFLVPGANTLFVGDLIAYRMTGFLLEGRLESWLTQLREVETENAGTAPAIMPGHGAPGEYQTLLDWQKTYLSRLSDLVRNASEDGTVAEDEVSAIMARMNAEYPDHDPVAAIPNLLELNIKTLTSSP